MNSGKYSVCFKAKHSSQPSTNLRIFTSSIQTLTSLLPWRQLCHHDHDSAHSLSHLPESVADYCRLAVFNRLVAINRVTGWIVSDLIELALIESMFSSFTISFSLLSVPPSLYSSLPLHSHSCYCIVLHFQPSICQCSHLMLQSLYHSLVFWPEPINWISRKIQKCCEKNLIRSLHNVLLMAIDFTECKWALNELWLRTICQAKRCLWLSFLRG